MNYTKVSNAMLEDNQFSLVSALIYAKLEFRMRLSVKNGKNYVIYKINDLVHDIGVGRDAIINGLKLLTKLGYVAKKRKMFWQLIYLPKSKFQPCKSESRTYEVGNPDDVSRESRLAYNNKPLKNKKRRTSVCEKDSSTRATQASTRRIKNKKEKPCKYPTQYTMSHPHRIKNWIKRYGHDLTRYAIITAQKSKSIKYIGNFTNFITGILEQWRKANVMTLREAEIYEDDPILKLIQKVENKKAPKIPIFKI